MSDEYADEVARGFGFGDHSTMLRLMAAQGLHVVSAADKAVLDALSKASLADLQFLPGLDGALDSVYYAELSRRERKR